MLFYTQLIGGETLKCNECIHYEACNYWLHKEQKHLESTEGFVCEHFSLKDNSQKEIYQGCISLMQTLTDEFGKYLDFIGADNDEEPFNVHISNFEIVQNLLLSATNHSGGTSTQKKCAELEIDYADKITFEA